MDSSRRQKSGAQTKFNQNLQNIPSVRSVLSPVIAGPCTSFWPDLDDVTSTSTVGRRDWYEGENLR
jgi:hypothetical protein